MFKVWLLSLLDRNWINIIANFVAKFILVANFYVLLFSIISQHNTFPFLEGGIIYMYVCLDLILKVVFRSSSIAFPAFSLRAYGSKFLNSIEVLLDSISIRNILLPLSSLLVPILLDIPMPTAITSMCLMSWLLALASRGRNTIQHKVVMVASLLVCFMGLYFELSTLQTNCTLILMILFLFYYRLNEPRYIDYGTQSKSSESKLPTFGNVMVWLDERLILSSRHLKLIGLKIIAVSGLYLYIIISQYGEANEINLSILILIQTYFTLAPLIIIPYFMTAQYSNLSLLMSFSGYSKYFTVKLQYLQFLNAILALILCLFCFDNLALLVALGIMFIFNFTVVTPLLFLGILLAEDRIDVNDSSQLNTMKLPSAYQGLYMLFVLIMVIGIVSLATIWFPNIFLFVIFSIAIFSFALRSVYRAVFTRLYYRLKYRIYIKLTTL
ncbi:MAG: hypothetical protein P1U56_13035 [Saprospiraceae bacterium]|nr:hypothetical protein [Saprospiraceae bacterium]